jgi:phage baseplate assembly protein W
MAKIFSLQDGNLSKRPITTSISRTYSDIDCSFEPKPSGDLYKKTDAAAVFQSVKNLLMTNHGEIPYRPLMGGNLQDLLFSLSTEPVSSDIEDNIRYAINAYEPRATIRTIKSVLRPDYNSIDVTITFSVVSVQRVVTLNVNIARNR